MNQINKMKLDTLPDETLLIITEYVGKHSCYLGFGAVNHRLNRLFDTYGAKLCKKTSFGGYAPFRDIVKQCVIKVKSEEFYEKEYRTFPKICYQLADGIVSFNRRDLLQWALRVQNGIIFRVICERALKVRKLHILKKVWMNIIDSDLLVYMKEKSKYHCASAAKEGDLDCLRYLHEEIGCNLIKEACSWAAAAAGNLDCLVYLHEHECEWSHRACTLAARRGHLHCLRYLNEHGCKWIHEACTEAASYGQLDCLKYLHEHGCEWIHEACSRAARHGHLDCLIYLHEEGCEWNEDACSMAAAGGKLNCLRYLHENGCRWNHRACELASYHCYSFNNSNGRNTACLRYLRDNGLEWDHYDKYLSSFTV